MSAGTRVSRRCGRAPALLCAAALVVQATLVPWLHGQHGAGASLARAVAFVVDICAPRPSALHPAATTAAHDAATCPFCATLAHVSAVVAPAGVVIGALPDVGCRWWPAELLEPRAPDLTRGAPRGPPALVS